MKLKFTVLFFLFSTLLLIAETVEYSSWIGMGPAEAYEAFGPPSHIYVHRGESPEEDTVVFYREGLYLFWFENRVWQVRADRTSSAVLGGIRIGDTADRVTALLGKALHSGIDGSQYYEIHRGAYPLRLRVLYGPDSTVDDLYLYRGDF
ncbi:hypothetical protein [Marispirochaeta sp.]|uniref:hypothetical protein n=1 Tax=Marispirochaeta sp. TaxID=2038653 RepID=UPI0029C7C792|nr:hypothetical protein [Marispirochaeta sp.]